MENTIFYVGGSKGGVGKSITSIALVQFLLERYGDNKQIHLIETDASNPDVERVYNGKIPVTSVALDDRQDGWITFYNIVEQSANTLFVVNSAAGSNLGIGVNGKNFITALRELPLSCRWITFWPINCQLDSVNLLINYLEAVNYGPVFVVRNLYWGSPQDFRVYDTIINDEKNKEILARIDNVLDFPRLNDLIAVKFCSLGKTIPDTSASLNAFMRQTFRSWISAAFAMFEETGLFSEAPLKHPQQPEPSKQPEPPKHPELPEQAQSKTSFSSIIGM